MEHSRKKAKDSSALAERIERDESRQASDLADLEKGNKDFDKRIQEAKDEQKKKSALSGKVLSQAELDQYRTL